jgi:hypothetical protein
MRLNVHDCIPPPPIIPQSVTLYEQNECSVPGRDSSQTHPVSYQTCKGWLFPNFGSRLELGVRTRGPLQSLLLTYSCSGLLSIRTLAFSRTQIPELQASTSVRNSTSSYDATAIYITCLHLKLPALAQIEHAHLTVKFISPTGQD